MCRSSIGNFTTSDAREFMRNVYAIMDFRDSFVCCFDSGERSPDDLNRAYNDSDGWTERFIKNGLVRMNKDHGFNFDVPQWDYVSVFVPDNMRMETSLKSKIDQEVVSTTNRAWTMSFKAGDSIHMEYSHKYTKAIIDDLGTTSGGVMDRLLVNDESPYFIGISRKSLYSFLWEPITDALFFKFIGKGRLYARPIGERNDCVFYYGHIACFYAFHMLGLSEDSKWYKLFWRGRDPDVENVDCCHDCSPIPEVGKASEYYPPWERIVAFVQDTRRNVVKYVEDHGMTKMAQFCVEHELMHCETLVYMARLLEGGPGDAVYGNAATVEAGIVAAGIQRATTRGLERCAYQEEHVAHIQGTQVDIGTSDQFVWDCEKPKHQIDVKGFTVSKYPISYGEFVTFVKHVSYKCGQDNDLWVGGRPVANGRVACGPLNLKKDENAAGGYVVRSCLGHWVPLEPVGAQMVAIVSGCEAEAYCRWLVKCNLDAGRGARLMTEDEYDVVASAPAVSFSTQPPDAQARPAWQFGSCSAWPSGCGGGEGPNKAAKTFDGDVPVGGGCSGANGVECVVGTAWEMTSTVLDKFDGFVPMDRYPGYSADFFDGKHMVVRGGSTVTDRSLLRRSFRNWYQKKYMYALLKFRVVYAK